MKEEKSKEQHTKSKNLCIRVAKENAIFLYQLLESYEGIMNYSTLPASKGSAYRDIAIYSPLEMCQEREEALYSIQESIPIKILPYT